MIAGVRLIKHAAIPIWHRGALEGGCWTKRMILAFTPTNDTHYSMWDCMVSMIQRTAERPLLKTPSNTHFFIELISELTFH